MSATRRKRQEILDEGKDRLAGIFEDLTWCSGPKDESWPAERQAVWDQMQGAKIPAWARVLAPSMTAMVKASEQVTAAPVFNVLVLEGGTVSLEEFERRAKEIEQKDAVDVQVITKALAASDKKEDLF